MSRIICLSVVGLFLISSAFGWELPQFTEKEKKELARTGSTRRLTEQKSSPWPESTIFSYIDVPADVAAGLFSDYELHKTYVPKILESKIKSQTDQGRRVQVSFILEVPLLPNSHFVVEDVIKSLGDGAYEISWSQVESDSSEKSDGYARFFPIDKNKTLFIYHSSVTPKSAIAVILEKLAVKEAFKAFKSIETYLVKTWKENPSYSLKRKEYLENLFPDLPLVGKGR